MANIFDIRAALLVHNFPLSWNYVKHVNRVVLLLNRLCRGLWFYSFSPSSYLNFDLSIVAMQFLRCGQIQRKLTKVQSCDRCNLKTCLVTFAAYLMREGFFTQNGQKLTELGVAKCYPLNPWNPPNLSLNKGKQRFWLTTLWKGGNTWLAWRFYQWWRKFPFH